nr:NIF3-like protein 1 isoform X2 [Anas platyrhynchos]
MAPAASPGQRLRSSGTETPTGPDEVPQGPALGSRLTHTAALRSRGLRVLPQISHRPSPQTPGPLPPRTSHRRSAEADARPGCAAEGAGPSADSAPSASSCCGVSWDNVGLLVEPSPPHIVKTLFLTNDLTEEVMEEAVQKKADLILSYHPPIFTPLKRVTWKTWKERLVVRALEHRIGIYSPHTAYDAIPHGINNWLTKGLGACNSVPLHPSTSPSYPTEGTHRIEFCADTAEHLETVLSKTKDIQEIFCLTTFPVRVEDKEQTRVSLNCSQKALLEVVALLSQNSLLDHKTEILILQKPLLPHTGMGRLCTLSKPASLSDIIERIKSHLKLPHVRLALGTGKTLDSPVKKAALCAGSGSSVLKGTEADLYLTAKKVTEDYALP